MTFKVDVETLDSLRRRLAVEVPAEKVSAEIEQAYAALARAAKVPGFRPGRVPRTVLERLFGDRVRGEVFARLIQDSYREVIEARHIEPLGQPEIVTEQAQPGEALRYSATVEVKPDLVIDGYTGIEVERPTVTITDADVDAVLERLRHRFAQLRPITERSQVALGDVVTLDYVARTDDRVVGRGEGREVEIGTNGFPVGFDDQMIGSDVGSERRFRLIYPAEAEPQELAGKTVEFQVRVRGLSHKDLPALDDEFAKDHGECETLSGLRQQIRQRLEEEARQGADDAVRERLLAQLGATHEIPVPAALVRQRTDGLIDDVLQDWKRRRIHPRDEARAVEELRAQLEPRAHQQVKAALLLEAIAQQEQITVSEDELETRIGELAAAAGSAAERIRALYTDERVRRQLRVRMLQSRALDVVLARASVKTVSSEPSVADASENG